MTEQQRAEYMAIVAGLAGCSHAWGDKPETIAAWAMKIWFHANKEANEP